MPQTASERRRRLSRRAAHRDWLNAVRRECSRCGQTNPASLRIIDPQTGEGVGLNAHAWWMSEAERDRLLASSEVICSTCFEAQKTERG